MPSPQSPRHQPIGCRTGQTRPPPIHARRLIRVLFRVDFLYPSGPWLFLVIAILGCPNPSAALEHRWTENSGQLGLQERIARDRIPKRRLTLLVRVLDFNQMLLSARPAGARRGAAPA